MRKKYSVIHNTSGTIQFEVFANSVEEALEADIPDNPNDYVHEWSTTTTFCNSDAEEIPMTEQEIMLERNRVLEELSNLGQELHNSLPEDKRYGYEDIPSYFEFRKGDIFKSGAEALVNPVNTKGVMGKGLALKFKEKFPDNFYSYKEQCKQNKLKIGSIHCVNSDNQIIFNFPTKDDWRSPSKIEYIELGLKTLRESIKISQIKSIAIPALGCGLGGLDWNDVKPLIIEELRGLSNVKIIVYEP